MAVQEQIINSNINIGIIGYNNSSWIAGQLYIQSLLVGQSLLNAGRIDKTSLFLFENGHNSTSYQDLSPLVKGIYLFDYYYGTSLPILKKSLAALERWRRNKRPFFPENNLPAQLEENKVEVIFPANGLLSRKFSSAQQVCWVPDFQHLHLPQFFSRAERLSRTLQFKKMARKADKIILSNPYSYNDACNLVPGAKSKFELLPFCMFLGDRWREEDPEEYRKKYNLPQDYLMFPSQFWKHKNHKVLFQAIKRLKDEGKPVVLACTGAFHDFRFPKYCDGLKMYIHEQGLEAEILLLGLLPRKDQVQLMRGARAIIQPSLFEGWSALLEDCRGLGKTVFVSRTPMHMEQEPDHAIFFDPHSPDELASLINKSWDTLPSGVDSVREQIGERKNIEGLKSFAKRFLEICHNSL